MLSFIKNIINNIKTILYSGGKIRLNLVRYNLVRYNLVRYNLVRYNLVRYNLVRYNLDNFNLIKEIIYSAK